MADEGTDRPAHVVAGVERNASGQLVVRLVGRDQPVVDARVARCFPWSVPQSYISIRTSEGKEVALLESLEALPEDQRRLVEEELRDKVFNPRIRGILECKDEFGVLTIRAWTDRGEVSFQIRGRDDVRILSATRALFRDIDGNTYELPDLSALDLASRRHLQQFF